ncbi:MAG: A/G-specific adenine glycosylase, partial [Alphaproteobacteria bacterium]
MRNQGDFAARLLGWYDAHARALPWRVPPGSDRCADPYAVWLSEVMLQQTTVSAVIPYFARFMARWPTVHRLADAPDEAVMAAWAGLGYYARARNLLACARVVSRELDGRFPGTEAELRRLPGIGPYTAAAISAIAFGARANVVDGNVERVIARHARITAPLPGAKRAIAAEAGRRLPAARCGDYAQALMDLGALVCTPAAPRCGACPVAADCAAHAAGDAAALPARTRKP